MTTQTRKQIISAAKKAVAKHVDSYNDFLPVITTGVQFAARENDPSILTDLYDVFSVFGDVQQAFYKLVTIDALPGTKMSESEFVLADPVVVKPVRYKNWHRHVTKKKAAAKAAKAVKDAAEAKRTKKGDDVHGDVEVALRRVLNKYSAKGVRKDASARVALDELAGLITDWYGEADSS